MSIDLASTGITRLDRGAMQNWSDMENGAVQGSPALRSVLSRALEGMKKVLIVGPVAMDLATEIMSMVDELTIVARSIPDCAAYADALNGHAGATVICGDLLHLSEPLGTFDVVIALNDFSRIASLEDEAPTWRAVFEALTAAAGPDGRLVFCLENELGLQRMTSISSRYTRNDNSAWDVTSTYDATRPRSVAALRDVLTEQGVDAHIAGLYPTWDESTVIAWGSETYRPQMSRLLDMLTLSSPALRRLGADPSRVTRAAVLAGRVSELASGWVVVRGVDMSTPAIVASGVNGRASEYLQTAQGMTDAQGKAVTVPETGVLFGEELLDACAAGTTPALRTLLTSWSRSLSAQATDGRLPATLADQRFDNLVRDGETFTAAIPAAQDVSVHDAAWDAVVDFVHVLNARGARHPWPAAMDARTMAATIGAMAGLDACADLDERMGRAQSQLDLPAHDVSGLLAVIERLEERNKALASRADWFETKLNQRERELRSRASRSAAELAQAGRQQEALRKSAEDIRKSLTFRVGNVAMSPLKQAKKKFLG